MIKLTNKLNKVTKIIITT